jgi:outer membrane protein assembly factor BamB
MSGIVTAVDAASGKQLWQKPATTPQPLYHTGMSPLVDRGLVIVHVGGHNQGSLTAYDVKTGAVKWHWDGDGPGYGSPIALDVDGTRQIVTFTQEHVVGVSAATGELLWKRPFSTPFTQNAITPIPYNQTVIVSGLDQGVSAFRIVKRNNAWATENVWENKQVSLYMTNGVLLNDTLVGMSHRNSGQFFALDAKTGTTIWTGPPRQGTNASIARAGDLLLVLKDDGDLVVARSGARGLETSRTYTVADSATWAAPAISGDRFFVKDVASLALWALK